MSMSMTNKLIAGFVMLILGIVFVSQIADIGLTVTDTTGVESETHNIASTIATGRNDSWINETIVYTLTNAPTGWKVDDCPITEFVLANSSGTALTADSDYTLTASAGTFVFISSADLNTTIDFATNDTIASYSYCGDDYLNLTWGRTSINLVPGFFAIALLLVAVGLFYSVAKEAGIIS